MVGGWMAGRTVLRSWDDRCPAEVRFLRALLAAPDDPVPRAAYADWLAGEGRAWEAVAHAARWGSPSTVYASELPVAWGQVSRAACPNLVQLQLDARYVYGLWAVTDTGAGRLLPKAGVRSTTAYGAGWDLRVIAYQNDCLEYVTGG